MPTLTLTFEGKPLTSLSRGDVDFGEVALLEQPKDEAKPAAAVDDAVIVAAIKAALGDKIADVRASQRLIDSASCLVAGSTGPDRELERLLARQNRGVGAKPIRSKLRRRINVRRSASGAGVIPRFACDRPRKASIGFASPSTLGTSGRLTGRNAQGNAS